MEMELFQKPGNEDPIAAQPVAPIRSRRESLYSLRNWSPTEFDDRCRSVSHMGLLMPLYLSPMLYYRTVFTSCLYCLLLVLIMWALNAAPKPAIAILHMVNLPLMNLMSAEELATQYLTVDALLMVILLYLVVLVDSLTDLVKRIAYASCSRYGLRRNGLFLSLCGVSFIGATVISPTVMCVPLLYVVDRVFSVIYRESMDQQGTTADSPLSRQSSITASNVPTPATPTTPLKRDVDSLFEKLAVYSQGLPKMSSSDQISVGGEKQPREQQQQSDTNPEGHQGDRTDAGQPAGDAAEAVGAHGSARTDTAANPNDPLAEAKKAEFSAQPTDHVIDTSRSQGESKSLTAAAVDNEHKPVAEDDAHREVRVSSDTGNNDGHKDGANDKHPPSDSAKQGVTEDDKHAVAIDDNGANEDTKTTTKRGGKKEAKRRRSKQSMKNGAKGGGKEPGTRSFSKRKSKKAAKQNNVGSPDKTGAQAEADECLSRPAALNMLSPETAVQKDEIPFSVEAVLSQEAALSPAETSALVTPDTGAHESHQHSKKSKRDRKSHKKQRKLDTEKHAAEATQADEGADSVKSPDACSPSVGEDRSMVAGGAPKPDTGAQATLNEPAGVASPDHVVSPSCSKSPHSDTQLEGSSDVPNDPSTATSPTGPAPKVQQAKAPSEKVSNVTEKRTLVIQESPSHMAAVKERHAADAEHRAQKDVSMDEHSLTPAEAPVPKFMQRRASILRQPGALPRFGGAGRGNLGRRTSVVDFGADEYAAYVPGDVVTKPRILTDVSISTLSASAAAASTSPERRLPRKSISLRKVSSREESRGYRPAFPLAGLNEELSKRKRHMKRRADIHNAFLMGPSLMIMLGSLCSYWTGPAAEALKALAKSVPSPEMDMTASSWCVLTLPGCVMALLITYCYLSWVHVLPYEPDDMNTEHSAALQSAFTKMKTLGTPSLAGALAVHGSVLVLGMCVPAGYIGNDIRLTLLGLLTSAALLVNAFGSLFDNTRATLCRAWYRLPWGVIFVLGGAQVASKVVEDYELLPQLFQLFKPTFWTARSHIEVQAILATISSLLAETTNNRKLCLLMMPIVQDIAESKNMYPMFYAIPVVVGASSNVIMPISIPMVVMHEIGRVPFFRLVALGVALKIVLVGVVLLTANAIGKTLYDWGNHHVVPDA